MAAEPEPQYKTSHSREKLDEYITDYNKCTALVTQRKTVSNLRTILKTFQSA
nr:hypothetical protein [Nonlabens xylanidelens]